MGGYSSYYGVIYAIENQTLFGETAKIEIRSKYTLGTASSLGDLITGSTPLLILQKVKEQDIFSPACFITHELSLVSTDTLDIINVLNLVGDDDEYQIRSYVNGSSNVITTYINKGGISYRMSSNPINIKLESYEGFNLINKILISDTNDTVFDGKISLMEVIAGALYKLPYSSYEIRVHCSLFDDNMVNTESFLSQTYIDADSLYDENDGLIDCFTAITNILSSFMLKISVMNGHFYISNICDLSTDADTVYRYSSLGVFIATTTITNKIELTGNGTTRANRIDWINANTEIQQLPVPNEIIVNTERSIRKSFWMQSFFKDFRDYTLNDVTHELPYGWWRAKLSDDDDWELVPTDYGVFKYDGKRARNRIVPKNVVTYQRINRRSGYDTYRDDSTTMPSDIGLGIYEDVFEYRGHAYYPMALYRSPLLIFDPSTTLLNALYGKIGLIKTSNISILSVNAYKTKLNLKMFYRLLNLINNSSQDLYSKFSFIIRLTAYGDDGNVSGYYFYSTTTGTFNGSLSYISSLRDNEIEIEQSEDYKTIDISAILPGDLYEGSYMNIYITRPYNIGRGGSLIGGDLETGAYDCYLLFQKIEMFYEYLNTEKNVFEKVTTEQNNVVSLANNYNRDVYTRYMYYGDVDTNDNLTTETEIAEYKHIQEVSYFNNLFYKSGSEYILTNLWRFINQTGSVGKILQSLVIEKLTRQYGSTAIVVIGDLQVKDYNPLQVFTDSKLNDKILVPLNVEYDMKKQILSGEFMVTKLDFAEAETDEYLVDEEEEYIVDDESENIVVVK